MECETKSPKNIDCAALNNLINFPCLPLLGNLGMSMTWIEPWGPYVCIQNFYFKIMKKKWEVGAYADGLIYTQLNWRTKKETHYFRTPPGQTRQRKKDALGILRWYDVPQKCMYLSSNAFQFTGPHGPTHLRINFQELYTFPMRPDGTPDVPHADLWKHMSKSARKALYNDQELKAIDAYQNTTKYYDTKYTLCVEKYQNVGRSLYDKANQKPATLINITWTGQLEHWFTYHIRYLDGKKNTIGRKTFDYTD